MGGKSTRTGACKCYKCRKPFTGKVGTIFEASHASMHLGLQGVYLMFASKMGISSNQLHRTLDVILKTAWFMSRRIREAMRPGDLPPFGENGGAVEVNETFIGKEPGAAKPANARGGSHKMEVPTLVDRDTKRAKSIVVDDLKESTLILILRENISKRPA